MIKDSSKPIISIKNLSISFLKKNKVVKVVNNISFNLLKNEVLGIVGESGSGKSVTALSILKLLPKNKAISKGEVIYNNTNLLEISDSSIRQVRKKDISIIFQEPMSALNPTMKCIDQLRECFELKNIDIIDVEDEINLLIKKVKLEKVDSFSSKYPHQLSGGQKQRLMIAMAIACKPKLLIADEPTTALDVTVQKEIIELLLKIKNSEGLSIIFISHDLALVSEIADRLIVMYKGEIIEKGGAAKIFSNPIENYTKGLLYSRPNNKVKLSKLPTVSDYINNSVNNTIINDKEIEISRHKIYSNSPILEIKNLSKYFGGLAAVSDCSLKVSRGNLRWKMMMESLQERSNFKVVNIVTTYASDAGDSPITDLNFTLIFENADFVPTTGTTIDGSTTTTTKELDR